MRFVMRCRLAMRISGCMWRWGVLHLRTFAIPGSGTPSISGYVVDLGERCSLPGWNRLLARLPTRQPANRPFFEAIGGLIECLEALGHRADCERLCKMRQRLFGDAP